MKRQTGIKLLIVLTVVFMLGITASITAFAEANMSAYVSSDTDVSRGEEITFTVGISNGSEIQSILIIPTYDSDVFELTGGSWTLSDKNILEDSSFSSGDAVILFESGISVDGSVLTFTLKTKNDAAFGTYSISAEVVITDSNGNTTLSTSPATVQIKCNHNFTKADTTYLKSAATCTSPAVYYKSCVTCGEKGTETFDHGSAAEHSYTRKVTTDAYKVSGATCTAEAVYNYCCATCDKAGTATYKDGTTLPHSFTKQVITDDYKVSSADCDSKAVYNYCCATCDAKGTTTFEYGEALGHTGGTATCIAKAVCTRCSQEYGNTLEHVYTDKDATATYLKSAATCTSKAIYFMNCVTCDKAGAATFEYGSTEPHSYTRMVPTDDYKVSGATCTAKAVYNYCCATCDKAGDDTYTYGEEPAHSYTRKVITDDYKVSPADCDSKAVYNYCCATCDAKGTTTFEHGEVLEHTGGTATCTAKAVCTRCSQEYSDFAPHAPNADDGDCTTAITCSACGAVTTEAATSHTGGRATCKEKAKCSVCGKEYGSIGDHAYGNLIPITAEKHTKTELAPSVAAHYHCSDCGKYFTESKVETTLPDLTGATPSHSYGEWKNNSGKHWKECSCGLKSEEGTHTNSNGDSKCDVCDKTLSNGRPSYPSHTHSYSEATCTKKATCSCGATMGELAPHKLSEATCTAKAKCSVCEAEVGELAPHKLSEATCTAKAKCSVCEAEVGELAPHKLSEATCTAKAKCSVCEAEVGELAPHKLSEATCTAKAKCSVCETEVGELLAHSYVDGKCVCGATDPNYVPETDPVETDPAETDPTEPNDDPANGNFSAIGIGAAAIVVIAIACGAVIFLKKKKA